MNMTKSTVEELLEILEKMLGRNPDVMGTSCSECKTAATTYYDRVSITRNKEAQYYATEDNSEAEKRAARQVTLSVKLEVISARRFLLHVLRDHN